MNLAELPSDVPKLCKSISEFVSKDTLGPERRLFGRAQSSFLSEELQGRPDIVFAYANVFFDASGKEFRNHAIFSPDKMFDEIVQASSQDAVAVARNKKKLIIAKKNLNCQTLRHILSEQPRVLVIMCHGGPTKGKKITQLTFEDVNQPYKADLLSENRLRKLLTEAQINYKTEVIVLSTCHSEKLGQTFQESI